MKEKTPYSEAMRYMKNSEDNLIKAGSDGYKLYLDVKYVQTACSIAYLAVVIAIKEYLKQKEGSKFKEPPKSIEEMRTRVAKISKKMLSYLNSAYEELHLHGYYYGSISKSIIRSGFNNAYQIIEIIKPIDTK